LSAPARASGGFTMVELILVMIIVGVLAAVMLPRLSNGVDTEGSAYTDRIVSTLRLAQKSAVARRRVVCVATGASAFTLRIASAGGTPPGACTLALAGLADADSLTNDTTVRASSASTPSLVGATLYFQPNGDITTDAGGTAPVSGTITVTQNGNKVRDIFVEGATGYVDY